MGSSGGRRAIEPSLPSSSSISLNCFSCRPLYLVRGDVTGPLMGRRVRPVEVYEKHQREGVAASWQKGEGGHLETGDTEVCQLVGRSSSRQLCAGYKTMI